MSVESVIQGITRETLKNWRVAELALERDGAEASIATEDQLLESRRLVIADDADVSDLWVFGYGSLIYNPIIDYSQRVIAKIYGYHRRFCLWTKIGRGSPNCPGLVLSLDRGGSCKGVAFQLNAQNAIAELDLLWRREMMTMAYQPRLLCLHTDIGLKLGLAFVSNPAQPNYAPPMTFESTVKVVANAVGFNGPCCDYLYDTVKGMKACGIRDHQLEKLVAAVQQRLA
ncbi:MAG: gamma-glutamylcyclotransferase [Pseudomonadota bacterium]|nr:gamma-glutamylcyclotransferase [Pseudomonadota bacterium]